VRVCHTLYWCRPTHYTAVLTLSAPSSPLLTESKLSQVKSRVEDIDCCCGHVSDDAEHGDASVSAGIGKIVD
jgi:hypothetical protein